MNQKTKDDYTDEELTELARKKSPDTKLITGERLKSLSPDLKEMQRFILHFQIVEGVHNVSTELLHDLYQNWSTRSLSLRGFGRYLAQYFKPRRAKTYRYYKLNITALEISLKTTELRKDNEKKY